MAFSFDCRIPSLLSGTSETEHLKPTPEELDEVLQNARSYWSSLAQHADSEYKSAIPQQCLTPERMLKHVPSLPDNRAFHHGPLLDVTSSSKILFLRTQATWSIPEGGDCGVGGMQRKRLDILPIGFQLPTSIHQINDVSTSGPDYKDKLCSRQNMIMVLVLAWSYIFSAEVVYRKLGENATLKYTNSTAEFTCSVPGMENTIDIGDVNDESARWWAAILSPDQGWKAIVHQDSETSFISPWSLVMDQAHFWKIRRAGVKKDMSSSTPASPLPPSPNRALEILVDFCTLHGIHNQLLAALSVAILIPSHKTLGKDILLPSPAQQDSLRLPTVERTHAAELSKQIPYYMSLSCNFDVVGSSLCGAFWEENIPCNFVSPWLHPVLNELRETYASQSLLGYNDLVCIMCAVRRPGLAALWLGATLSGMASKIINMVKSGAPYLDTNASAWTGYPQSFMDLTGSGPYFKPSPSGTQIARADTWRLLYLPPSVEDDLHYNQPPFSPWEPVGMTTFENSAIRVKVHCDCPRHPLVYRHWSWLRKDGSTVDDAGYGSDAVIPADLQQIHSIADTQINVQPLPEQNASINACNEIFGWVTRNCEGNPPEPIYSDKWLEVAEGYEEMEPSEETTSSDSVGFSDTVNGKAFKDCIQDWISGIRAD